MSPLLPEPVAAVTGPVASARRTSADAPREALVAARGLTKRFGERVAVDGIDLEVGAGEVVGLLGPNGAGKTTTMRMVACVSPQSGGLLRVLGRDPVREGAEIRRRLGVVPQADTLDLELTVLQNLLVYARYFDIRRQEARRRALALLDFVQLGDRRDDQVDSLSGGMKRRLTIARGLINEPEMVLLDEPTTGLDPQARHLVWDRLYRLRSRGTTLLITTHYMDEAEQLCDRVVVMDKARIVAAGTPRQLIERHAGREVVELRFDAGEVPAALLYEDIAERVEVLPDRLLLSTADGDRAAAAAAARSPRPAATLVRRATLEDVFLRLTGRSLVD